MLIAAYVERLYKTIGDLIDVAGRIVLSAVQLVPQAELFGIQLLHKTKIVFDVLFSFGLMILVVIMYLMHRHAVKSLSRYESGKETVAAEQVPASIRPAPSDTSP